MHSIPPYFLNELQVFFPVRAMDVLFIISILLGRY